MDVLASYGSDSDHSEEDESKSGNEEDVVSKETEAHLSSNFSMQDLKSKHQMQIAPFVEDKKVLFFSLSFFSFLNS